MQSIVGYSDDDRSDDDAERTSPRTTASRPRSKDSLLRRPVSTPALQEPKITTPGPILNEPRDHEDTDSSSEPKQGVRAGKTKSHIDPSMIRRPQPSKSLAEEPDEPAPSAQKDPPRSPRLQDLSLGPNSPAPSGADELAQLRALLRPPPIPGVENFGIPPPSENPVDAELSAKISKFLVLKKQGTHFNDILMRNKSFNNPHIYAKLVEFVDVNETGTNFPKDVWDPHDVQPEWYAEELATAQKKRSAAAAAAQAPGKRSRIAFNSVSSGSTSGVHPSTLDKGNKHSEGSRGRHYFDDARSKRSEGSRRRHEDDKHSGQRFHPYQPKTDANMGWMPRNHTGEDRSSNRW